MRPVRMAVLVLASVGAIGAATACNDTSGPGGVSVVGTYTLVSVLVGPFPAPGSSGTLAFTSSTVDATINIVSPNSGIIHDTTLVLTGSYTTKHLAFADSIYLELGAPLGTVGGTYAVSGATSDTLSLSVTTPLVPLGTIWHKN